jgi:HK97 family phage major capsid protein
VWKKKYFVKLNYKEMNINELQVRLNEKLNRQEEILNVADAEQRDFNETEKGEFDTLTRDVNALTSQIQAEQAKDEARAKIALAKMNTAKKSEDVKVAQKFSFIRALDQLSRGVHPDNLTGAEGEMHQEGVREARNAGRSIMGFAMPAMMMRAQDAATAATAGNLIATELDSTIIPALRPRTVMAQLGAMQMNGLIGNLDLPAGDGISTAVWETETAAADNTDPSTRLVSLRPNRLAAKTTLSKQLLIQSSFDAEAWVRSELENAVARAVDSAAIQGNSGNINGILGTSGVSDITFGGAVTRAKLVNLITKIAVENADVANLNFLMNPIIKGELMSLETDSGSGLFVMDNLNSLLGYNVAVSTLVPTNIASTKTAVIFGNFADLVLANWGGVDITVDPYTLADNAQVKVVVNSFWDVKLKQPKSFAFGNDISWTALS